MGLRGMARVGARGGAGRLAAMTIALAVGMLLALAGEARAGEYSVVECGWSAAADADWASGGADGGAVRRVSLCDPAAAAGQGTSRLGGTVAAGAKLATGSWGGWRWSTPPGAHLVELNATGWRWLHDGLSLQVGWLDGSGGFQPVWTGGGFGEGATRLDLRFPVAGSGFEQRLVCTGEPGGPCALGGEAWAELGQLVLTLSDDRPPAVSLGGDLAAPGWKRGTVAGSLAASDSGSGLRSAEALVDGARRAGGDLTCATTAVEGVLSGTRLRPCPPDETMVAAIDTAALADGEHEVRACAADFSGASACAAPMPLATDNTQPLVAFDPGAGAGRLRAEVSDPASGPASGAISYRPLAGGPWIPLNSELRPQGAGQALLLAAAPNLPTGTKLLYRAEARDLAGNLGTSVLRGDADGAAAGGGAGGAAVGGRRGGGRGGRGRGGRLRIWLDGSHAGSVEFGARPTLRGRLVDAHRSGLGGARVRIESVPARGAAVRLAAATVTTRRNGGFALTLPAGPSRSLRASYAGGAGAAAQSRPLQLRVRAGVTLRARPTSLRTGDSVVFSGRVRRGGAVLPRHGKLVAIQYLERATHRWRPVMFVRSDRRGAFAARYRFRYVEGRAVIRLRALALAEARWPYAPGSSQPLTIRVSGR